MQHFFALVTLSLHNLREVESLICDFDDEVQVVVGTGFLVYMIRRYSQVLAQSAVLRMFGDTEDGKRLLSEDDFQYPKLLVDFSKWTCASDPAGRPSERSWLSASYTLAALLGCFIALSLSYFITPNWIFHLL